MPGASKGLHSSRLGLKQVGSDPVDYMINLISGTITVDPPSIATLAGAVVSGIAITGAALGDMVELFPTIDTQGITFQGAVSAANTIRISFFNPTAGTIDLASGSWGYKVIRGF